MYTLKCKNMGKTHRISIFNMLNGLLLLHCNNNNNYACLPNVKNKINVSASWISFSFTVCLSVLDGFGVNLYIFFKKKRETNMMLKSAVMIRKSTSRVPLNFKKKKY